MDHLLVGVVPGETFVHDPLDHIVLGGHHERTSMSLAYTVLCTSCAERTHRLLGPVLAKLLQHPLPLIHNGFQDRNRAAYVLRAASDNAANKADNQNISSLPVTNGDMAPTVS